MSTITQGPLTSADLLAMPNDGVERWLINGELREGVVDVTRRGMRHTRTTTKIARLLDEWLDSRPGPHGLVLTGDAGFELDGDPSVSAGIDVAYISAELAAATPDDAYLIRGIPVLAVEILSPSDTQERVAEKIAAYMANEVPLVWVVDPIFQTVTIHRPDAEPVLVNNQQTLSGEPQLPGFETTVAALFA